MLVRGVLPLEVTRVNGGFGESFPLERREKVLPRDGTRAVVLQGNPRAEGKPLTKRRLVHSGVTDSQKMPNCRREDPRLAGLEAMLVDAEHLDLGIEGLPGDAELCRRSGRAGDAAARLGQRGLDQLPLAVRDGAERRRH